MAHKESNRPRRVAELIKRELALIIPRELEHPLAHRITLTHAEAPRDMSSVKIYFTLLDGAAAAKEAAKALNQAAGFLRHTLRDRVVLRAIPELRFQYDESVDRGARLTSLIDKAIAEDKEHPQDD
ncbi:MAG: 30S ribosome-binding factor RbfA [Gammaproteobacteria bacterium]|nr:30S ribosome-binding factor RbfA [Gammaproteobacteria bacterium]